MQQQYQLQQQQQQQYQIQQQQQQQYQQQQQQAQNTRLRHRGQNAPKYPGQSGYLAGQTGNVGYPGGQVGYPGVQIGNVGYPVGGQGGYPAGQNGPVGYPGVQIGNAGYPVGGQGGNAAGYPGQPLKSQQKLATSTTTTPKPEVPTNYRQQEKKILDRILDKEVYDRRMRPSGVNSSGKQDFLIRSQSNQNLFLLVFKSRC